MNRPLVKLCGIRSLSDLETAVPFNPDYIGFIFAESKRRVKSEDARRWLGQFSKEELPKAAGVFVNASDKEVIRTAAEIPLDVVQLHGDESAERVFRMKSETGLQVWKALRHHEAILDEMKGYEGAADGFVIDAFVRGARGGTGTSFNWDGVPDLLMEARKQKVPCFIAGGIRPDNVEKLLAFEPDGIDVSSGIETDEQKDVLKIGELMGKVEHYEYKLS
ncbi:phosphoribosylanthranilate isomerase [Bacillus marinisedimentorum]|uniref:phosphoribosylanthranilate isomerase n=1 Tax=Bacillus marinisedimentorum TaxID=1821260 RepID=UPI0007DE7D46|nr:phosphoribosylanthranilate isomerase [Bacillus marinisedimentorum]